MLHAKAKNVNYTSYTSVIDMAYFVVKYLVNVFCYVKNILYAF